MFVACHDGTIRILKIKKTKIELIKILSKDGQSCMSIELVAKTRKVAVAKPTKQKKDGSSEEESSEDDTEAYSVDIPVDHVYAGYEDGSIKKWNLTTGNCDQNFNKNTNKATEIASILKLQYVRVGQQPTDCYLVSGDSNGEVCFWQTKFGTLVQTFKQLKGDILALAHNPKMQTVYATGIDSRVISI